MTDAFTDLRARWTTRMVPDAVLDFRPEWGVILNVTLSWLEGATVSFDDDGFPSVTNGAARGILVSAQEIEGEMMIEIDPVIGWEDECAAFVERMREASKKIADRKARLTEA